MSLDYGLRKRIPGMPYPVKYRLVAICIQYYYSGSGYLCFTLIVHICPHMRVHTSAVYARQLTRSSAC